MKKILSLLILSSFSGLTLAHGGHEHGFAAGFTHPFTGLDHLAAMLAVGLWSAGSPQRRWLAPLAFVAMLVLGALFLHINAELMIAVSLLVAGALLIAQKRISPLIGAAVLGGFALFHGAAHGQELQGGAALMGMVLGTAALHGLGIALGSALPWLPRLAGAAMALFGIGLLAS